MSICNIFLFICNIFCVYNILLFFGPRYDIKLSIGFCLFRLPFVSTLFFVTHCCCALSLRLGLVSPFPSSSSTSFPTQTNPPWLSFHNLLSWIFNFLHFSPFFSLFYSPVFVMGITVKGDGSL